MSENKFGPHRVVCRAPLTNIRITTFFAGEHEVRVLDPSRVELLAAIGCEVIVEGRAPATTPFIRAPFG